MTYQSATTSAPADADFVVFKEEYGYVFAHRPRHSISWDIIANTDVVGYAMILGGISAAQLSLWDHDARRFLCGTIGQLKRDEQEPAA